MASQSTHISGGGGGGGGMPPDPPKCVYAKHAARPCRAMLPPPPPPPPPPPNPHSQALIITYNRVLSTSTSTSTSTTSDKKLDESLGTRLLIPRNILIIMMSGNGPDFEYINPAMLSNFDGSYQ